MTFPQTPVGPCKAGVSQVNPDNDIMVCDAASGHQGQMETAMIAQNYAMLSMRPRQAFDFAGRTGIIAMNVDAITQGEGSWWTSVYVTDQPSPGVINSSEVLGLLPTNGMGIDFNDQCGQTNASQTKVDNVYTYANTVESTAPLTGTACFSTSRGHLNHIEIHLSASQVSVWASDFSPDNVTFPNFRQVGSASISLPFTRGYVHFQQNERAPRKNETGFYNPVYANYYWTALGFDGPVLPGETSYMAPDSLTGPAGSMNVGYAAPHTFSIPGVNSAGITNAMLTLSATYTYAFSLNPGNVVLRYSINGRPSQIAPANYVAQYHCSGCPGAPNGGGGVPYAFPIDQAALTSGTNTVAFTVDNQNNSFPPVLANVDLMASGGGPTPTPTPVPTVTPTLVPTPTATAIPPTVTPMPTSTTVTTATSVPTSTSTPSPLSQSCTIQIAKDGTVTGSCQPAP
jgi:hypothetical protein